jgi:predicted GNAT family acetyltransferase
VVGDQAIADCFAAQWCRARGVFVKVRMAQRIYRLDQVADVPLASGRLRLAQPGDEELVAAWGRGYHEEIYGAAGAEEPATDFRGKLRRQEVFVWEDPTPVSMASKARPTPNGISLLGVYTPPARRRRGYATACVAALCGHLLQAGYRFCVLYTDLANPTSNSIYQRIGFRPACDSADNVFGG